MNNSVADMQGIVLLPPDPLLSNTHCRQALLQALTDKVVYQEVSLLNETNTPQGKKYTFFSATKLSDNPIVWDLDDGQRSDWGTTIFPSPIKAVIIPVIHPRSLYHKILSESKLPLTQEISQNIAKLIDSQKRHLRNLTSPIRAYLKMPIILVYIQEIEEQVPLDELIGKDLYSVTHTFVCKIGDTDSFTSELRLYMQSLQ
jgi:hypothetical protein